MLPPVAADNFSLCYLASSWDRSAAATYGNKSANLMRLTSAGFRVPPGVCLSSASHAITPTVRSRLVQALARLPAPWAVRSSSLAEDAQHRAFPGIYNTMLGIDTIDGLLDALHHVSSAPDPDVVRAYSPGTEFHGLIPALIQTIINPRAGGVAFTNNPITTGATILVNACWGLGHPVVDGTVDPDEFEMDRTGKLISESIAVKEIAVDWYGMPVAVPAGQERQACLSPTDLASLARIAIGVEQLMGAPQDIEWVQDMNGVFWLVQTRPITTL